MTYFRVVITYIGIVMGLNACDKGDESYGKKRSAQQISAEIENLSIDSTRIKATPTPTSTSTSTPAPDHTAAQAEVFKTILYPMLQERCGSAACHGQAVAPFFAQADTLQAWQAAAGKVNFLDIKSSQLVVRLRNFHQCWSSDCEADAAKMTAEIQRLNDKFAELNILAQKNLKKSSLVPLSKAEVGESEPNATSVVNLISQSTEKSADLVEKSEKVNFDAETKTATYLEWPLNSPTTKIAFNMKVPDDDNYYLLLRVKLIDPNGRINSLTSTLNGVEVSKSANPAANRARDWQWYVLTQSRSDNDKLNGKVSVVLNNSSGGFLFNRIALVKDYKNFTNDEAVHQVKIIRVPINELCEGKNVALRVEVSEFEPSSKTLMIRNLRIETSERLHIRGIEVMINGKYDPTNATFQKISEAVLPPGMLLSRSALLAVGQGGIASDQVSFAVERCD